MKETLKVGSILVLEREARYAPDLDKLRENKLAFAHNFSDEALSRDGSISVKITGFALTHGFFVKVASRKVPHEEGWIRIAGLTKPRAIAVEVERS